MTASCGRKAIEIIIAKTRIDIILLDLKMPRGDGFAVLREMRKLKCVIPVIIIGGSVGNEEDIRTLEELGYPESEIIYKPANLMVILEQIKKKTASERS
jgi:DNA-binding response OmpR family regulator